MKMKQQLSALILGAAMLCGPALGLAGQSATASGAQSTTPSTGAKQDMKDAGADTKAAAKDTANGTKKGTKKAYNSTKKGTKKVYNKTKSTTKGAVEGAKEGAAQPQ
jgi:hypothetical protein